MSEPNSQPAAADPAAEAVAAIRRSASWFYWIAGLSVINVLTMAFGSNYSMVLGSGISQFTQALGQSYWSGGATLPALGMFAATALFVLAFVFFGWRASRLTTWAFIAGMVLYAVDGLIFVVAADWVGVGFHAFVLYMLYRGLAALLQLDRTRVPGENSSQA